MKYRTIRKEYQHNYLWTDVFVDPYAHRLSPFTTKLMLKLGLIPNQVTVGMILSGILGATLFALPPLWCKITGTVFIHLWYILDCSDGEVARITKRYSLFGTEIDYTAHVINHPLFVFAFLLSLLQRDLWFGDLTIALIAFGVISLNLMYRMSILFMDLYRARVQTENSAGTAADRVTVKIVMQYCISIFLHLPNFALIFPLVYFVSANAAVLYMIAVLAVSLVMDVYLYINWLRKIVHI